MFTNKLIVDDIKNQIFDKILENEKINQQYRTYIEIISKFTNDDISKLFEIYRRFAQ